MVPWIVIFGTLSFHRIQKQPDDSQAGPALVADDRLFGAFLMDVVQASPAAAAAPPVRILWSDFYLTEYIDSYNDILPVISKIRYLDNKNM